MAMAPRHRTKLASAPSLSQTCSINTCSKLCKEPATEAPWHHSCTSWHQSCAPWHHSCTSWHHSCTSSGYQAHRAGPLWLVKKHVRLLTASASESIQHTEPEQARQAGSRQEEAAMPLLGLMPLHATLGATLHVSNRTGERFIAAQHGSTPGPPTGTLWHQFALAV